MENRTPSTGIVATIGTGIAAPFTGDSDDKYSLGEMRGAAVAWATVGAVVGIFGTRKYLTGSF